jgi:predicted nucleotide-binding protein
VKKVFVVHGRNHSIRTSMFLFLRELGLQPLEWGDLVEATNNPTPTMIEILRAGFDVAQAAVVLFTPDDEAKLNPKFCTEDDPAHERELTPQPRPNVIFEAGMVMAHFPKRTVIAQIGHIRPFTDLSGIHFIKLDNSIESRRDLVRRLRMAGCAIEAAETKTGWQTAGNFDL